MKVDKTKLKRDIWYEDDDGNRIETMDEYPIPATKVGAKTYHCCFPLEITEHVYTYISPEEKEKCKHKRKYLRKDTDVIKGYKGRTCMACGCTQNRKWYQIWGRRWEEGTSTLPLIDFHTSIGGGNEDVILAMANSGDYSLSEALVVWANACERCMNVLAYKYLDGKGGYPEHSEEWEKCNTVCDFCRDE